MSVRLQVLCLCLISNSQRSFQQNNPDIEIFKTELFLDRSDLNAGLYEGEVRGRRRFGDTQVPHGVGTIYYFTTDKFNRVNYTGEWVDGQREGNGTTSFKDGALYRGGYHLGLEDGPGFLLYPNGNTLDAQFSQGKIQGHGVFRYGNGDQREGFFKDNILEGQVIFTKEDGSTFIETWEEGKQVVGDNEEEGAVSDLNSADNEKLRPVESTEASRQRTAVSEEASRQRTNSRQRPQSSKRRRPQQRGRASTPSPSQKRPDSTERRPGSTVRRPGSTERRPGFTEASRIPRARGGGRSTMFSSAGRMGGGEASSLGERVRSRDRGLLLSRFNNVNS